MEPMDMRLARVMTTCLTVLLLPSLLAAQRATVAPSEPICPAGQKPLVDTSTVTVVVNAGTAWNRRQFVEADRTRILYYADAIRQRFVAPPSLGALPVLAEWTHMSWGGEPSRYSAVGGKIVLVVKPNGRLRQAFWQVLPFSTPLARAFYLATVVADTSHDFEGIPGDENRQVDDTLVIQLRSADRASETGALPLMRAQLVSYLPDTPASVIKRGDLYYPLDAERSKVENEGEMQVLIGTDGKAVMNMTQITRIDWRDFITPMRRAVEGTIYQPAMSNGCAVPSIYIQPFKFGLIRP
jgi:hypothetical protein